MAKTWNEFQRALGKARADDLSMALLKALDDAGGVAGVADLVDACFPQQRSQRARPAFQVRVSRALASMEIAQLVTKRRDGAWHLGDWGKTVLGKPLIIDANDVRDYRTHTVYEKEMAELITKHGPMKTSALAKLLGGGPGVLKSIQDALKRRHSGFFRKQIEAPKPRRGKPTVKMSQKIYYDPERRVDCKIAQLLRSLKSIPKARVKKSIWVPCMQSNGKITIKRIVFNAKARVSKNALHDALKTPYLDAFAMLEQWIRDRKK